MSDEIEDESDQPIRLSWGETPWDSLSRDELLKEVWRYHSALQAMVSVVKIGYPSGNHYVVQALEKARQADVRYKEADNQRREPYRAFFRHADDLLFDGMGNGWVICDRCEIMWAEATEERPKVATPRPCPDCKYRGITSVMRPICWDDLKPKVEERRNHHE